MIEYTIFEKVAMLISNKRKRELEEHSKFLLFYGKLTEVIPPEVATDFGKMAVKVRIGSEVKEWYLEINAMDHLWWTQQICNNKARFVKSVNEVQIAALEKLVHLLKPLTEDDKKRLNEIVGGLKEFQIS